MNLCFFEDAIEHILIIIRILRQPRGNAMLVGVGGLGKQSLTRLATFIIQYKLAQIEATRSFNLEKFKEWERKNILIRCAGPDAGPKGTPLSFLLTDSQITDEAILEDINNL